MGTFIKLEKDEIESSLKEVTRQYLAGNIKRPQTLKHIHEERLEIGISSYSRWENEAAHTHKTAIEYQYVLSGWTSYIDVETGETFDFVKGDFYAILPETVYAQKVKPGTRILFIKVPSVNDKVLIPTNQNIVAWLNNKMKTVRTDFSYVDNAPKPNSIKPASSVALINDNEEILLLKRSDSGNWTMPGGTLDFGESLMDCAIREVSEECGLRIELIDIIGTYTDPNIRIGYSDGEVRQEFTIVFLGKILGGGILLDEESSDYKWIGLIDTVRLPLAPSQKKRIEDVRQFLKEGKRHIG